MIGTGYRAAAEQVGGDPTGFVDRRETTSRMHPSSCQIKYVTLLELVVWPEIEHLVDRVRKVEGRSAIYVPSRAALETLRTGCGDVGHAIQHPFPE
ncbi:MAG: hypothetical protein ACUVWX_04285 [Kiritimatiellia bacterium]